MSVEQTSKPESIEWRDPITARELMEDFKGYTEWLINQGLAFRENDIVIPTSANGLGRSDLIIEYQPARDEIWRV